MEQDVLQSILDIVRACDSLQLCTFGLGEYPETRHVTNAMNRTTTDLALHFLTGTRTPKYAQIQKNPNCCLYYFNDANRHAVRLFGKIEIINDMNEKHAHWRDEYKKFGYSGPDDAGFALLKFIPMEYKFYIGDEIKNGKI